MVNEQANNLFNPLRQLSSIKKKFTDERLSYKVPLILLILPKAIGIIPQILISDEGNHSVDFFGWIVLAVEIQLIEYEIRARWTISASVHHFAVPIS